jgi:hypothetical protein
VYQGTFSRRNSRKSQAGRWEIKTEGEISAIIFKKMMVFLAC